MERLARKESQKAQERQRRRRIITWSVLFFCELLVANIPATVTAIILVPLGRAVRGYEAFGVEWLIVAAVFCIAYALIHNYICNKIFEEA